MKQKSLDNLKLKKKPVVWNDQEFESVTALQNHLGVSGYIWVAIRNGWKVRGHWVDYVIKK